MLTIISKRNFHTFVPKSLGGGKPNGFQPKKKLLFQQKARILKTPLGDRQVTGTKEGDRYL